MPPRPLSPGRRPRSFVPRYEKPIGSYCDQCALRVPGQGYVPGFGAPHAPIMLVGEAPGIDEVISGEGFVGAAGSMLTRVLRMLGRQREQYRIDNALHCCPPQMEIEKWPTAIDQCRYVDDAIRANPPKVIVPMGGVALRRILNLAKAKHVSVQNFHGTVHRLGDSWVVPTYHPSYLQRGAVNLMQVMAFDLQRAQTISTDGWQDDPGQLWIDPPLDWFKAWAATYLAAARSDPYAYPLAVDLETPEKGSDEAEALGSSEDESYQILRVNLSAHPDEGITIPADPAYLSVLKDVLAAGGVQYYWFKGYDFPRLVAAGLLTLADSYRAWDCMWMWKVLQSDLPMGLGFVAPFYSTWGAWKHLSDSEPARYAAIDGLQTRRVGDGCVTDLVKAGQWEVFTRHLHDFHRIVLAPATAVGVAVDRAKLLTFKAKLDTIASRLLDEIASAVPPALCPLTPKDGLTRPPLPTDVHTHARDTTKAGVAKKVAPDPLKMALYARARVEEQLVLREVQVCLTCQAKEVSVKHRCADRELVPQVVRAAATVTRWFWREPFNPDSPDQLLAYALAKGHEPGKAKKTNQPSMDRETLNRLSRETGDPLYRATLDYRAVGKVRGTYVIGTEKRLDAGDRLHGTFTFKPSTMRLAGVNPNLQNVVADKGGTDSLAAGFRSCIVARGRWVEEGSEYADAP